MAQLDASIAADAPAAPAKDGASADVSAALSPAVIGTHSESASAADARFQHLPTYTKSLLRIRVPVRVTLAEKRAPVEEILRLGPGSIVQFDKSCDEMLEMEVGNRRVAQGEAVKVGDKFGLRVTGIVLPDERFRPLRGARD